MQHYRHATSLFLQDIILQPQKEGHLPLDQPPPEKIDKFDVMLISYPLLLKETYSFGQAYLAFEQ